MTDYSTDASTIKTALDAVYAKKTSLPTKTSDLTNDGDGTNAFLTQHQSLTDYVQKSNGANTMTDSSAYSTIGTSANATQKQINAKIDEKLDDIYNTFLREIISISASRPYLLSGEKTDLLVNLTNGLGTPLANKSVTISDGTSSYSGITNNQGIFTLLDIGVTGDTTFTASYGTETATCLVEYCDFVDYCTSSNNKSSGYVAGRGTYSLSDDGLSIITAIVNNSNQYNFRIYNGQVTVPYVIEFDLISCQTTNGRMYFYNNNYGTELGYTNFYLVDNAPTRVKFTITADGITRQLNDGSPTTVSVSTSIASSVSTRFGYNQSASAETTKIRNYRVKSL